MSEVWLVEVGEYEQAWVVAAYSSKSDADAKAEHIGGRVLGPVPLDSARSLIEAQ